MKKEDKIFIAGHKGLVGSAIVRKLNEQGHINLLLRNRDALDLRNNCQVNTFFDVYKPKYVFLAAATVGGIFANNSRKGEFIYDNLAISSTVINAAKESGVNKLINLGSSCIFPKYAKQPITESALLTGELEPTNDAYAIAKIAAIKMCSAYNEQYNTEFLSLMPTNLYGPNDNYNLDSSHVIPGLIRKFYLAKLLYEGRLNDINRNLKDTVGYKMNDIEFLYKYGIYEDRIILPGTGKALREFLHVDDLADACIYTMQNLNKNDIGEIVNIGQGEEYSIKYLSTLLKRFMKYPGKIYFSKNGLEGTPKKILDTTKMENLGWQANINFKSGLKMTIDDYLSSK